MSIILTKLKLGMNFTHFRFNHNSFPEKQIEWSYRSMEWFALDGPAQQDAAEMKPQGECKGMPSKQHAIHKKGTERFVNDEILIVKNNM